ncbi:hypothetical protein JHFBIEKO_2260 [Methylobacterium mesophilicum]|uniref:hypothetical protein n=1 Tax=Methylobacterium mesophilicum TaxID=39956 RepID=UPI001EE32E9C|nr:hypothetical protein [Methylobacterium mesophilicum]GJE21812.1 hypothetical protein JHFBIEKO_2260 [Methylobacterium mesophilicum]
MKKSKSLPELTSAAPDAEFASTQEERFWREQELMQYDNESSSKHRFWTKVERQGASENERRAQEEGTRLRLQRDINLKLRAELTKLRNEKKNVIRHAIKIINPKRDQWRRCCREVIYELAEFKLARVEPSKWNKDNHVAAVKIVKSLKKARNETQLLPDFETNQISVSLKDLIDRAEEFARKPYGERRSAADKSRAVRSAYSLLSAFDSVPTGTTKNGALYKLAAKFAGDDAGMDHHCRSFFEGAKRHKHEQSAPGPSKRANRA